MSDRRQTPHLDAGTTTGSAHTNNANGVRAGRRRPADSVIRRIAASEREVGQVGRTSRWPPHPTQHLGPEYVPPRCCGSARATPPRDYVASVSPACAVALRSSNPAPREPASEDDLPVPNSGASVARVENVEGDSYNSTFRRSNDSTRRLPVGGAGPWRSLSRRWGCACAWGWQRDRVDRHGVRM